MLFFVGSLFIGVPAVSADAVNGGNKFCPVSGDKVSGKDFVEHDGKKYGLCCSMCAGKFKRNSAKYLAKMEKQEAQGQGIQESMT